MTSLKVGITGGIGSGKSTVTKIFESLGVPVYDADREAKDILQNDPEIRKELIEIFGKESFLKGKLNRPFLASKVFADDRLLKELNKLVHPKTIARANSWMKAQDSPYAVKEAALIFESGAQSDLDFVIGVYAPAALRILRTMKRDNITREAVIGRMQKQLDENIKMKLCDIILVNDEQELLLPQVIAVHEKLLELASNLKPGESGI